MRASVRVLTLAVVLGIVGQARAAEAGRVSIVITRGDDIVPIRDLSLQEMVTIGVPFTHLGYRYTGVGVFFLDLWRWDGEFVAYNGSAYVTLHAPALAYLGGPSVPWRYRCPPGLLILVALIEMAIVTSRKRQVGRTLWLGGGMFLLAGVFYLGGLTIEWLVPALVGTHHVLAAWFALQYTRRLEQTEGVVAVANEPPRAEEIEMRLPPPVPPRGSPPVLDQDPFRSPPRAALAVVQPPQRPSAAPLAPDASAEPPKLLR